MEKIKQFIKSDKGKDILIIIIVILVGLASFELGRLSKENSSNGIKIEYPSQDPSQEANVITPYENTPNKAVSSISSNSSIKNYFASSRGHKYYPAGCSAGKTIKQENRVYFATSEEAEKAGYELSSSCQ